MPLRLAVVNRFESMCYSAMVQQNLKTMEQRFGAIPVRESFSAHSALVAASAKGYRELDPERSRIFPNSFCAVMARTSTGLQIYPMRYQMWPSSFQEDPQKLSLYNARLDRLQSPFWGGMWMSHHGFIPIEAFFEWVRVSDVLQAGQVQEQEIKMYFERKTTERKKKIESSGRPYRLTKAEKTPFAERKLIISFTPDERREALLVPVLWTEHRLPDGVILRSFAVVTKEAPPEVALAGHHRCPVILGETQMKNFLNCFDASSNDMVELLKRAQPPTLVHHLAAA